MRSLLLVISLLILGLAACAGAGSPAHPGPRPEARTAAGHAVDDPAAPAAPAPAAPPLPLANRPGEIVPLEALLVPGKVTVIDFYADWCAPCKALDPQLAAVVIHEPRIAVRKLDIVDDTSEVARHYEVDMLPHVRIYGPDGALLHTLVGPRADRAVELARQAAQEH